MARNGLDLPKFTSSISQNDNSYGYCGYYEYEIIGGLSTAVITGIGN